MSNIVDVHLVTRKIDGTTAYRSNGYKSTTMPNFAIVTDADFQRLAITAAFRDRMIRKLNSGDTFESYDCEFPDYKASKVRIRTERKPLGQAHPGTNQNHEKTHDNF